MPIFSILLAMCIFVFSSALQAEQIIVTGDTVSIRISDKLKYFQEEPLSPILDINEIRKIPDDRWIQLTGNPSFRGSLGCCYWFKTTLLFPEGFEGYIEIDRPGIDYMAAYLIALTGKSDPPCPHHASSNC